MRPHKPAELPPSSLHQPDWPARVVQGAPVLLAYLDNEQRFRYANPTHRAWLGVEPQALLGKRLIEAVGHRNYERAGFRLLYMRVNLVRDLVAESGS